MALTNSQLLTILNNAVVSSNQLLEDNGIRLTRAKEIKDKVHAKGFYFGNESILNLRNPSRDPFHVYIISPDDKSRRDDYSLVIYPFNVKKISSLIDEIDGVELGYIQLSSNFNAFHIHNKSNSKKYCGVGYSVKIDNEEALWRLIVEIKKRLMLQASDDKKLSSVFQLDLPKIGKENPQDSLIKDIF
ncbi:hypothetical protein HVX40_24385 (plasmid) [Escherichia coli]|nr:hypothetical protein [Escherichia coli]MBA8354142.1 hypothetical protein [Escherichia coli]